MATSVSAAHLVDPIRRVWGTVAGRLGAAKGSLTRLIRGTVGLAEAGIVGVIFVVGYLLVIVEWTVLSTVVTLARTVATFVGIREGSLDVGDLWAINVMDDRPSAARMVMSLGLAFGLDAKTAMDGHLAQLHAWRYRRPVVPGLVTVLGGILIGYVPMRVTLTLALVPGNYMYVGVIFAVLVALSGLFAIGSPEFSSFFGGLAIAVSVLSLVGALGGFFVGMALGCTGGSLLYAWQPPEVDPTSTA